MSLRSDRSFSTKLAQTFQPGQYRRMERGLKKSENQSYFNKKTALTDFTQYLSVIAHRVNYMTDLISFKIVVRIL